MQRVALRESVCPAGRPDRSVLSRLWAAAAILLVILVPGALAQPADGGKPAAAENKADQDEPWEARSTSQVNALIAAGGKEPPEWWADVDLQVPDGLDLTWQESKEGWKPNKYIGQYITSILNPNPGKWRGGIKLLTHSLSINQADPAALRKSMQALGRAYFNYERDWARAAFWLDRSKTKAIDPQVSLAECYWRLGSKPMATGLLKKLGRDVTREGRIIKLYAEMGNLPQALKVAEDKVRLGMADAAYLAAANACRMFGKYEDAATYYQKVGDVAKGTRDLKRNKERAERGLEAMKLIAGVLLAKIPDGTYTGASTGYRGDVEVSVEIKGGRIETCEVTRHKEDMCYTAPQTIPAAIVRSQGFKGVDAVTGATITSDAIINAAAKALAGVAKP